MSLENDMAALRQFGIFSCFDEEGLRLLTFGADRMVIGAGRIIVERDQRLSYALILETGRFLIEDMNPPQIFEGEKTTLIGEPFLLNPNAKSYITARAEERCTFLRIKYDAFWRVLNEYPHNAVALRSYLRDQINTFSQEIKTVWR